MNRPADIIGREITLAGAIPFARFMEIALFCPVYGYYETEGDKIGARGDFYTSVSVGSLFGELLAFYFSRLFSGPAQWEVPVQILEAGAHDGTFAGDVLSWIKIHQPDLFSRLIYVILEPSVGRRGRQRARLEPFGSSVQWMDGFAEVASEDSRSTARPVRIIFCNELLDAMPVHRIGWDANRKDWFEWGVTMDGSQFKWARLSSPTPGLEMPRLPSQLLAVLPDMFTTELRPAAVRWWAEAADALDTGWLAAFDYGFAREEEQFAPERPRGTLRGYRAHHAVEDVLGSPGQQDLTAHVNFAELQAIGESRGLVTETFTTQARFLTGLATEAWQDTGFSRWASRHTRQFQTLTHPDHLGHSFKVLIQRRSLAG